MGISWFDVRGTNRGHRFPPDGGYLLGQSVDGGHIDVLRAQ